MDDMARSPQEPPLHDSTIYKAVKSQDICLLKSLLDSGVDPNSTDLGGDSALHHAVRAENIECVKLLLDHGALPNYTNRGGHSALHFAAKTENIDILTMLLDRGADPNLKNSHGNSPLHVKVKIVDLVRNNQARALHFASHYFGHKRKIAFRDVHPRMVKALLKAGADAAITNNKGSTALHLTTCKDIALCLLVGGAPIDAQDNKGCTPLHLSVKNKTDKHQPYEEIDNILETLIFAGANLNIPDVEGKTLMDIVFRKKAINLFFCLMAKCKTLDIKKNITRIFEEPGSCNKYFVYKRVNFVGASLWDKCSSEINFYKQFCYKEIDKMKSTVVDGVCLYDVLKCSLKALRFLNNVKFRSFIEQDNFMCKFPGYYQLIRMSVWEAEMLKSVVDELSVDLTIKLESVPSIPPEVWRLIITELDYQDVKNLKRALELKE